MSYSDQVTTLPVEMLPERVRKPGAYFRMGTCCVFRVVSIAYGRAQLEREGCSNDKPNQAGISSR